MVAKKSKGKVAAKKGARSKAKGAQERLDKLTGKYLVEGMSLAEARDRARAEMRANPRRDSE
jgi:hypothetical protein